MGDDLPPPVVPQWALDAGCPPPKRGEDFRRYVERIGLDPDELLSDLREPLLYDFANLRLAGWLERASPSAYAAHLRAYIDVAKGRYSNANGRVQTDLE